MPTKDQLRFAAQRLERRLETLRNNPNRNSRTESNALRIAIDTLRASAAADDQPTGDDNDSRNTKR